MATGKRLGFRWIDAVRTHAPKHWTPTTRAVAFCLGTYMDSDTGRCFVSQAKLGLGAGVTRDTARKHLRLIEADGWMKSWRHRSEGQAWATIHYQAVIPPEDVEKDAHLDHATSEERSRDSVPKYAQSDRERCVARARTNSVNSYNSASEDGFSERPSPPLSGQENPLRVEEKHRETFRRLGVEGRAFAAQKIAPGFSPQAVTELSLALMDPEGFGAVEAWLAEQEK